MVLYNITINIEKEIEEEWLKWIKENYVKRVMDTGLFENSKLFRLLNETENSGITYSLQFFTDTINKVETYLELCAQPIIDDHMEKFRHKHVAFMTLLESVE